MASFIETLHSFSGAQPAPGSTARPASQDDAGRTAIAVSRFVSALLCFVALPFILVVPGGTSLANIFALSSILIPTVIILFCQSRFETAQSIGAGAAAQAFLGIAAWGTGGFNWLLGAAALMLALDTLQLRQARARVFPFSVAAGLVWLCGMNLIGRAQFGPEPAQPDLVALFVVVVALVHAAMITLSMGASFAGLMIRLRSSAASLDETIANMREAVIWSDAQGSICKVSPNLPSILNEASPDLFGRGLFERLIVMDRVAYLKAVSDACHAGAVNEIELRLLPGADGNQHVKILSCRVAPGSAGGWAVMTLRDITSASLTLADLREAEQKRLVAARNRGLFVSALSHEVRTPLNAVIGFSEMLSNKEFGALAPEQVREYAGIINDSGQTLFRVVTATIDLIRIESGTYEIDPQPLEAERTLRACVDDIGAFARSRDVAVRLAIAPSLPEMIADRRSIKQVIEQVLQNAVKFSPAGGVVQIAAALAGPHVRVTVQDQGPGIAKETLSRLGDAFFQGDATYARSAEGAGMGLALAKGLARLNRCVVKIDSRPGHGTLVTVDVPLTADAGNDNVTVLDPQQPAAAVNLVSANAFESLRKSA